MCDAIGNKVRADRGNVASHRSSIQDMREGVRDKIEEEGGGRVTLPETPAISKKLLIYPLTDTAV